MKLLRRLTLIAIRFVSFIFKNSEIKQRVVLVSYFSRNPEGNLKCIEDYLKRNTDIEIVELYSAFKGGLRNKLSYALHTLKEAYYFNTSKVLVLEGNSLVLSSINKKQGIKAIQVWHAAGAFKKFGMDTKRLYPVKGLDEVFVNCEKVRPIYAKALNVPLEGVKCIGIPRMDAVCENFSKDVRKKMESKYPALKGKKIALYAPTFRGKGISDIDMIEVDYARLSQAVGNDYVLAVRLHPMMTQQIDAAVNFSNEDLIECLAAADLLITDYSSIIFEYSVFDRPMLFYAPDLQSFLGERGFYFGYEDFIPGRLCKNYDDIQVAVKNGDFNEKRRAEFIKEFDLKIDGKATYRAAMDIIEALKG